MQTELPAIIRWVSSWTLWSALAKVESWNSSSLIASGHWLEWVEPRDHWWKYQMLFFFDVLILIIVIVFLFWGSCSSSISLLLLPGSAVWCALAWDKMCKMSQKFKYQLDSGSGCPRSLEHILDSMWALSKWRPTFFWLPLVKYKGKFSIFQNWLKTHPKVVNAKNKRQFHHFWGMLAL